MNDTPVSDPAGNPFGTLSLEPVTTVDRVAEELRRSLFEGELGPGTPLREMALADALNVSRSTVREALGYLVAEGLADRVPNRGTQVRRLDPVAGARRVPRPGRDRDGGGAQLDRGGRLRP